MKGICRQALALACVMSLSACATDDGASADFVFTGGGVYTVNEDQPWVDAVAVRDGRIVFVGDDDDVVSFVGDNTEVIDLAGRMLMPGFHDSHMHPMAAGTRFLRCQLYDLEWPDEVLAKIRECAKDHPPGQWLRGVGLADEVFAGQGPHRDQLDALVPGSPAVINNDSGFLSWVNSLALESVGIDASIPDPDKGKIEREAGTGEPTGVLRNRASHMVYRHLPIPDSDDLREALRLASELANSYGITSVNAAQVRPQLHDAYVAADRAGEMTLRVQASQAWDLERDGAQLAEIRARRDTGAGRRYRADAVKLFLDGGITQRTAALLAPYVGTLDDRGRMSVDATTLTELVTEIDAAGMQVHVHVVGDRVVRSALDAFQKAIAVNGPMDRRHQMAHIVLIDPVDLPRFAELGITADFQPIWAYLDDERRSEIEAVGPERGLRLIAMRSMIDSGARVVVGSDWVSESMNPLYGIQIAVTRRPPGGSGPAWIPEQRATLDEMIAAYTINGAWLARQENDIGSIEVGKFADLIVLERNLFEVDPMRLKDVAVLLTLLEGDPVFRSAALK